MGTKYMHRLDPLVPVTTAVSVHGPVDGDGIEGAVSGGVDPDLWLQPSNGTIIGRINVFITFTLLNTSVFRLSAFRQSCRRSKGLGHNAESRRELPHSRSGSRLCHRGLPGSD